MIDSLPAVQYPRRQLQSVLTISNRRLRRLNPANTALSVLDGIFVFMTMTKQAIITGALRYGYTANYSGSARRWHFTRKTPTGNTAAFDAIVFANMLREFGIE